MLAGAIREFGGRRVVVVARRVGYAVNRPFSWASIDKRRIALDWSIDRLAREAGVAVHTLKCARAGRPLLPATLSRLDAALEGEAPTLPSRLSANAIKARIIRTCYRAFVAALAPRMRLKAEQVATADPHDTRGPAKLRFKIARCRMRAIHLTVTELDLSISEVARALGITKQAVSKALPAIEDERERAPVDALLNAVAASVVGAG
jgi:hypothetical protein